MIDVVAIVVYNRNENIDRWIGIFNRCETGNTKLVIIHNDDNPDRDFTHYLHDNVEHIHRKNIGYDIGAFQDVCKNRLPGFPEWETLLWCTDDTFPMTEDFLTYFDLKEKEGVRAMEISPYVRRHIRTTGFSISRKVAEKLIFPADPVVTKQHCYLFEHRWSGSTFIDQVEKMKLKVVMVAPRETAPLWDSNYHRREKREQEFADKWQFNETPEPIQAKHLVTIICPIFNSFPAVISSLIMQTFKDWKLLLIHDGPSDGSAKAYVNCINDDRIEYIETKEQAGNWGHAIRAEYLQKVKSEYVLITNPDNYYVPVFLAKMLKPFETNKEIIATYCNQMIHSYRDWAAQSCMLARGYLDCGGVLLQTIHAQAVGWHSLEHSADWFFFEKIIKRYTPRKFMPVKGCLFVHN